MARSMMNSEMVNPMPDRAAPPAMRRSVRPGRELPDAGGTHQGGGAGDADELADDQADDHQQDQRNQ